MPHGAATVDLMRAPYPAERGLDVYNHKLGMWVFLASEVMFFSALIGSYVVLRFGAPGEWAKPGIVLNIPITAFNTFLLICSSVSMVKAYAAIADGDQGGLQLSLGLPHLACATVVWVYLALLTAAELGLAFRLPISPNLKLALLLFLAVWKALLVALFFMHLKFERWNLRVLAIIPVPLALIFMFAAMSEHIW